LNNIILAVIAVCIVILVLIVIFVLYRRQSQVSGPATISPAPAASSPDSSKSPELLELEKVHGEIMAGLVLESRRSSLELSEACLEVSIARRQEQARARKLEAERLRNQSNQH